MQPTPEGYEFLVKYYQDSQAFKERYAPAPNKEVLLEQIAQSGEQNKALESFILKSVKRFENWFKKYGE